MKIEKWRAGTVSFESAEKGNNPFLDITITAMFSGPSGRKIVREAYWDGGRNYKISFAPTELGAWGYVLSAPEGTGLDGITGEIECIEYTGELPIYKHGFLKIGGQGRYIAYHDDTPFFWLGDTHWGFVAGEKWDESNHSKMSSMFKGMVDKRCEQGFNVYQTNLRSESYMGKTHYWEDGKEGVLPDVRFYQNEVDKRMQYIADKGLVNAIGFAWSGSVVGKLDLQKNLARYMIARYGALPVVWTLAGEVAGYMEQMRKACIDGWREVALHIEKLDGYGTLQTAHYTNERPFAEYYQNESWFDFTLNQAGHGDRLISGIDFRLHRNKYPNKPFIEGEGMYEFVHTMEEHGGRIADENMVRHVAYVSMQTGGCGYTYGAQGIWDTVWERPEKLDPFNEFNPHGITWYEAIEGEGAKQMGYMKEFYEAVGFHKLRPYTECIKPRIIVSEETQADKYQPYITASDDMGTVILYFTSRIRWFGFSVNHLKSCTYTVKWFNPRENKYILVDDNMNPVNGEYVLPRCSDRKDWMLIIREH